MKTVNLEDQINKIKAKRLVDSDTIDHKQREKNIIIDGLLLACNIPPRYKNKTLSDFHTEGKENTRIKAVIARYIERYEDRKGLGAGLLLFGTQGTGKSLSANIILQEVIIRHQESCLYVSAIDLIRDIRTTYSNKENTSDKIMEYVRYGLIVIDEIGIQGFSEDEIMLMNEIIDKRYSHLKSTILVSNMNREQVAEKIGQRVISRLMENGGYELRFEFDDRRLRNKKVGE